VEVLDVSLYEMQRCLFDYLRSMENAVEGSPRPDLSVEGFDLTDDEREALVNGDIAAIYAAGTHPVIVNGYCRAMGYKRADYRSLLQSVKTDVEGKARWQKS
jgi:hypothetical protein